MITGWIESDVEPARRSEATEATFRDVCGDCQHRIGGIEIESMSGASYVTCGRCLCPLKIVVHRYGLCPAGIVPPPEIP